MPAISGEYVLYAFVALLLRRCWVDWREGRVRSFKDRF